MNEILDQTVPPNLSDTSDSDIETLPGTPAEIDPTPLTPQPTQRWQRKPVEGPLSTIWTSVVLYMSITCEAKNNAL